MTKASTRSAPPTKTAGCRSNAAPDLASQILEAARKDHKSVGWRARLSPEQRGVVDEVKRRWQETHKESGISAVHLARTVISQMTDCTFPQAKQLASWLKSPL